MDQALKQRLVGALVITALAAIFVPMFFEDSVDNTRREVSSSDLAIPAPPEQLQSEDNPIPQTPQQVLHASEEEAAATAPAPEEAKQPAEIAAVDETAADEVAAAAEEDVQVQAAQVEEPIAETPQAQTAPAAAPIQAPVAKAKTSNSSAAVVPDQAKTAPAKIVTATPAMVPQETQAPSLAPQPKRAAPTTPPELQRWVVQLGSFAKKDNADAMVAKLRSQGFNAYGDSIQVAGKGTMYRVRIGPELDKKRAQAVQKKLQQSSQKSIVLSE